MRLGLESGTSYTIQVRDGLTRAAAKELGLNPATVIGWLKTEIEVESAEPRMRRVEAEREPRAAVRPDIVLELGHDVRVRGLRLEQLAELVRRLR